MKKVMFVLGIIFLLSGCGEKETPVTPDPTVNQKGPEIPLPADANQNPNS